MQGDDLEIYPGGDQPSYQRRPSVWERLRTILENLQWKLRALRGRGEQERRMTQLADAFRPGQRVKDMYGRVAEVTVVDPNKPPGLGKISVRYENGKELHFALAACGLTPLDAAESSTYAPTSSKN